MTRGQAGRGSGPTSARRAWLLVAVVVLAAAVPYAAAAGLDGPPGQTLDAINNTTGVVNNTTGDATTTTDVTTTVANNTSPTDASNNTTDQAGNATDRAENASDRAGNATDRAGNGSDARDAGGPPDDVANRTPARNVSPTATGVPNVTVEPRAVRGNGSANGTTVNVSMQAAEPNVTVPVNLSRPAARDDPLAVTRLDVGVERAGEFTLEVESSPDPLPNRTPAFDRDDGTQPLGFLSIDHSISDDNVSNVTFTFRVAKADLNDSEVRDVALYRHENGSWTELPTEPAGETDTHYVFRAESPGLSEFAAGKKTATFEIQNATVTVTKLRVGDDLRVRVRITNRGGADGTFDAELRLDGEVVASNRLTIAANGIRQTTFERAISEPGTYEVTVNEFPVGSITVEEASDPDGTSDETTGETTDDAADDTTASAGQPGFGAATAALAVTLAALAAVRRGRNGG
jgi:hypothetical protein